MDAHNETMKVLRAAANDFTLFKQVMLSTYERALHLDLLDRVLMEVVRYLETGEGIQRLMVEMPPRHGKTATVSQMLPAWLLGRNPQLRVILASYSASLATDNSRVARNMLRDPYYQAIFPEVKLAEDNQSVDNWGITKGRHRAGGLIAVGLGGSVTGKGAHCFPAGTWVATEHGDILIEDLCAATKPPKVWAWDAETGERKLRSVVATHRRMARELVKFRTATGRIVRATPDHLIYSLDTGTYIPAAKLKVGMRLKALEGEDTVTRIEPLAAGQVEVYDIQVEDLNNFFANGILVHNCLIIDDPHKNRAEAESASMREAVWQSYTNDLRSRFNDANRAAQIIIATRWHTDDLTGRLIKQQGQLWHRLRLPALAEERDLLGRVEGSALWPKRFDEDALALIQREVGEYAFASLYQQRPIPRGATMFDAAKVEVLAAPPERRNLRLVRYYDLAVTTKQTSDYTVGALVGVDDKTGAVFVLDLWRDKVRAPDMLEAIKRNAKRDGREVPIVLEAEKTGLTQLDYLLREPELQGYRMSTAPVHGDKLTRAGALMTRVENGLLKFAAGAWNREALEELSIFPFGAHDDQVDAMTGGYNFLAERGTRKATVKSLGVV